MKNVGGLCLRDDFAASIGIYRTVSAIYTHQGHNMELIWYFYIVNDNTRAPEARAKKIGPFGCFSSSDLGGSDLCRGGGRAPS